ncbi:hypothetical protein [Gallaecimonas xiamenensis]|uniref:Uncharacterized protein n=1 Tax=Gallaecimonas xiamenensis 3-C-1 TaxID=745411 RepID=K2J845_9GAMM|nr:hypothetical protein [Gallaecimonas xiamenensis]EKE71027.1 hypothetical protein B3C1_12759 [Gallaecimonas xiamenensis 3-C-1]
MNQYSQGANKGLILLAVLLCALLGAIGAWRWQLGEDYGVWVLGIFAVLALLFASAISRSCMWLAADAEGLTLHYWFSKAHISWQQVETLGLVYHHIFPSVGLCLTDAGRDAWPGRVYDRERMDVDVVLPSWLAARADRVLAELERCRAGQ